MLDERKSDAELLDDGIRKEQECIAFLERTPKHELADALRRELYDAEDAIPKDQWETLPRFILDRLHRVLDEHGIAAAIGLRENTHAAHLLHFFPTVRDVLRRYDLDLRHNILRVLQCYAHRNLDSGGRAQP